MKQTAVDWLLEKFNNYDISTGKAGFRRIMNQAKQMEKEQIETSHYDGFMASSESVNSQFTIEDRDEDFRKEISKEYYEKKYGTNDNRS